MSSPTNMHHEMEFDEAYLSNDMHGHGGSVASYAYLATMITNYTVGGEVKLPDELILRARDTQTLYLWAPELSTFLEYPRIPPTSLLMEPVIDELSTPPVGPTTGDRYLVGDAATDAWVGMETYIAEYDGAAWQFTAAVEGNEVWITNDLTKKVYSGVVWHSEDPNVVDPSVIGNAPRFSSITGEMSDSGLRLTGDSTNRTLFIGGHAGENNTLGVGIDNIFIGNLAGQLNTTGAQNTFLGVTAGAKNTSGIDNVFIGHDAGWSNDDGQDNTFVGRTAGLFNVSGDDNSYFGRGAGEDALGNKNSIFGSKAGYSHQNGDGNSFFGYYSGADGGTKSGSVFFGAYAGRYETGSNKLFIDGIDRTDEATARTNALIYGIFNATPANQELHVNGKLYALDMPELISTETEETSPNWFDDMLLVYDSSAGANRKMSIYNLFLNPKWGWFSKMDGAYQEGGLLQSSSGTGAGAGFDSTGYDINTAGIFSFFTGTDTTGRYCLYYSPIVFGNGRVFFVGRIKLPALSGGTNTYTIRIGFNDSISTDGANSVEFRYTDGANGGKYECVTRSNSVETASDSGIAADTGFHVFQIEVNANASSVVFKIDSVTVQTHVANIPTGTARLTFYMPGQIIKSAGTTSRIFDIDYAVAFGEFVTPRP